MVKLIDVFPMKASLNTYIVIHIFNGEGLKLYMVCLFVFIYRQNASLYCDRVAIEVNLDKACLLYTSDAADE